MAFSASGQYFKDRDNNGRQMFFISYDHTDSTVVYLHEPLSNKTVMYDLTLIGIKTLQFDTYYSNADCTGYANVPYTFQHSSILFRNYGGKKLFGIASTRNGSKSGSSGNTFYSNIKSVWRYQSKICETSNAQNIPALTLITEMDSGDLPMTIPTLLDGANPLQLRWVSF